MGTLLEKARSFFIANEECHHAFLQSRWCRVLPGAACGVR